MVPPDRVTQWSGAVPAAAADLTPDWLSSVFREHGLSGNQVTSLQVEVLDGEQGMTGDLARVTLWYEREAPGMPSSVIAKFAPMSVAARNQLSSLGFFEREFNFYRSLAAGTPVPTPRCYFSDLDRATGHFVLLLEDLAPARVGDTVRGCSLEDVTAALSVLARLHAAWWEDPTLAGRDWLRLTSVLAPAAMSKTFTQAWPSFLGKLGTPVSARITEQGTWIAQHLDRAARLSYESGPRTLIHNDVQPDNLFFKDGSAEPVVLIDWQLVTLGRGVVDAASLIRCSLAVDVRHDTEPQLVRAYHAALHQEGVRGYSLADCLADYELASVLFAARLVIAVGLNSGSQAHQGAVWDTLFPRLAPAPSH